MGGFQGVRQAGKGRAWYKNGINVLHLKGSYPEMCGQHGALLKDQIIHGAMPYLAAKNQAILDHAPLLKNSKILKKLVHSAVRLMFYRPMLAQVPREYVEEMMMMHRASGISVNEIESAVLQADILVMLMRYALGRYLLRQVPVSPGLPGCTSFVVLGKHTNHGGVLHGRNNDYPVLDVWDPYTTVFYSDPDHGQRTVGMVSAGVHTLGFTSANESGLALSTHFHCSRAVSPFGTPIHVIASEITRKARSIGQGVDIASSYDRAASWSIILSSARENRAVVIEMVHGKMHVRDADDHHGVLVQTNMYRNQNLHHEEILIAASAARDFQERYMRAQELIKQLSARPQKLDNKGCAMILADHFDRELGIVRGQGNTISVITTVTSVIFELSKNQFWVANGGESPTGLSPYLGFKMDENFEGFEDRTLDKLSWFEKSVDSTTILGTSKHEALKCFRKAYVQFHNHFDAQAALPHLERATELDPHEGNYWLATGHMNMRMKKPEKALENFLQAQKCPLGRHMRQTLELFTAHTYDCLNRRQEALALYQKLNVEETISPHVRAEAKICLKKPYLLERAQNVAFDFQFCDSFEYA